MRARRVMVLCLCAALLHGQPGGAAGEQLLPSPPSEELRARLGTIGVVAAQFLPTTGFEIPTRGKASGLAAGAASGFQGSVGLGLAAARQGGDSRSGLVALMLGFAAAPVPALAGGVYGGIVADSAAQVDRAQAALESTVVQGNIQEVLRDRVLQVARERTAYSFVPLAGPIAQDRTIDYRLLAGSGIDSVLEIIALAVDLRGAAGINPRLSLVLTVRTRLYRVPASSRQDGVPAAVAVNASGREPVTERVQADPLRMLTARIFFGPSIPDPSDLLGADAAQAPDYEAVWQYRTRARRFTEWGADDARLLREELARAYPGLAEAIVDELFLLYLPSGGKP